MENHLNCVSLFYLYLQVSMNRAILGIRVTLKLWCSQAPSNCIVFHHTSLQDNLFFSQQYRSRESIIQLKKSITLNRTVFNCSYAEVHYLSAQTERGN